MTKRSPVPAALAIAVLALAALVLSYTALRMATGHINQTRGAAISVPTQAYPLRTSGVPYGVNVFLDQDQAAIERDLDLAQQLGVDWVRQRFPWSEIEPQQGVWRWEPYDRIVDAAQARGLRLIAVLDTSPAWARATEIATSAPRRNEDYAAFVAAFVARYRGRVGYVQVWDQPNVRPNWGEQWVSPVDYVALLKAAYTSAKQADPAVRVLAGGLAPTIADDQWNLNDITYLRRMYAAGARGYFDILAAKPYGFWSGPDDRRVDAGVLNFSRLVLVREVMTGNGDGEPPVWAVETGWNALPAGWTGRPAPWGSDSADKQAQRLDAALQRARQEWPWLDVVVVNGLRFPAASSDDPLRGFALVDDAGSPRPSYGVVQKNAHASAVAGPGRYPPDTSAAVYAGDWTVSVDPASGKLSYQTSQAGAEFTLRFRGTDIILHLPRQADAGRLLIWLDGAPHERLPRDASVTSFVDPANLPDAGMNAWLLADDMADGEHELRVKVASWAGHSSATIGGFEVVRIVSTTVLISVIMLLALAALACLVGVALLMPRLPWAAWDAFVLRWPLWLQAGALALALAVYYRSPWLPLAALGALAFAALAFVRLDLAVFITVLTVPFYLYPRPIGGQAFSLPEVLALLCYAAWLVRVFGLGERRWRGTIWPVLFFLGVAALSLGATIDLRLSLRELRTVVVEPILLYIVAVAAFGRPGRLSRRWLAAALVLAGALAAGQSLLQYFITDEAIGAEGVARALGPYGSPNNLGLLLERVLPLALALLLPALAGVAARKRGDLPVAVVAAACTLLIGVALFLTYSVGAWLAAVVGLLVFAMLRGRRQVGALVLALALLAVLALPLLRVERVVSHLGLTGETTSALRIDLWRSSLDMLRDYPVRGVGLDGFLEQYRGVYIRPAALREPGLSHPHNLVLEWWLFLGVLGVVALAWLLASYARRAWRWMPTTSGGNRLLAQAAIAAMAAAVAHGMVDRFYFGAPDLAFVFFALLALIQPDDQSP